MLPPNRAQVDGHVQRATARCYGLRRYWIWVSQVAWNVSVPGPPMQTSVPPSARSVSLPPPPTMQSLPFCPRSLVVPTAVPMTRSLPLPPFAAPGDEDGDRVIPLQLGLGFFWSTVIVLRSCAALDTGTGVVRDDAETSTSPQAAPTAAKRAG